MSDIWDPTEGSDLSHQKILTRLVPAQKGCGLGAWLNIELVGTLAYFLVVASCWGPMLHQDWGHSLCKLGIFSISLKVAIH